MLYKYFVRESGQEGLGRYCMTLVMRYLSVSRVEKETNSDLKSSLLGSDRPSGLYNSVKPLG